jgi:CTP:molybdopterin cytidylyltransferase MocA
MAGNLALAVGYGWAVSGQPRQTIAAVVLAAGRGRRFGGPKQLHPIGGRPMLELVLETLEQTGIEPRLVVLGARAQLITDSVPLHGATVVRCSDWRDGQAASLRCGLRSLPDAIEEALVVLGDGPGLSAEAVRRVAAGSGMRAADYGHGRAHPVVIPRPLWPSLPSSGETPARSLPASLIDCTGLRQPGDVDYAAP